METTFEEMKIEELKQDIDNLKNAYKKIDEALGFLKDVESYSDEEYSQLYYLGESINEDLITKYTQLNRLKGE